MSYSYWKNFRSIKSAKRDVEASSLPAPVKAIIAHSLDQFSPETPDSFVLISASGHTNHDIKVTQGWFD